MSGLAVVLVVLAVAGIVAVRHADRRAQLEELDDMRRKATARRIDQTVRTNCDDWWMR
jgi:hypothetical protein